MRQESNHSYWESLPCFESFFQRITKHEMVVKNFICMLDSYKCTDDVLVYEGVHASKMATPNRQI